MLVTLESFYAGRILSLRSGLEPVGGFTPDRNAPPLPNTCPKLQNPSSSSKKPVNLPRTPVRFCRCRSFWSRSGVSPPTGTRPERSTLAKPLPKTPKPVKLFLKTRQALPNTGRILPLPVVLEPVGGCTPDRNDPPPPNIPMRFRIRRADRKIDFYFLSVVPLLSRVWIFPVGGSTPDRHKAGTLHPCQTLAQNSKPVKLFQKTRQAPPNTGQILPLPVVLEPVGGFTPDRNDPPPPNISMRFRIRRPANKLISIFCPLFPCFRVDGSFRSGVQPPTGTRPERSTPAKYLPAIPNP